MGSGGSGGLYRPSVEMMEQMDRSKDRRIAELEAAIKEAVTYADRHNEGDRYVFKMLHKTLVN